jgi:hypothetical protein
VLSSAGENPNLLHTALPNKNGVTVLEYLLDIAELVRRSTAVVGNAAILNETRYGGRLDGRFATVARCAGDGDSQR